MRKPVLAMLNTCVGQNNKCSDPLAALMVKAFPSKSTHRNFGEQPPTAIRTGAERVFASLRSMAQAMPCVGEITESSRAAVNTLNRCTREEFCVWIHERQEAMFLAVKWYVVHCLSHEECPVLHDVVTSHYTSFDAFHAAVLNSVGTLQSVMRKNAELGRSLLAADDTQRQWRRNVRIMVSTRSGVALRRARAVINAIKTYAKGGNVVQRDTDEMWKLERCMRQAACGGDHNLQARVLEASGIDIDTVRVLWTQQKFDRNEALHAVRRLDATRRTRVFEFAKAVEVYLNVHVHPLPVNVARQQEQARARRLHTDLVCTHHYVYGCPSCKEIKAFVVQDGATASNAFANGASRVLVDVCENGDDVLYCGRKQDQGAAKNSAVMAMCCNTRLVRMPAYGTVITWFGRSYSLCPQCTRVQPHGHAPCCICRSGGDEPVPTNAADETKCFHCGKQGAKHTYGGDDRMPVCGACRRPWMLARLQPGEQWPSDSLDLHRAIDQHWRTARWAEHFGVSLE